ncbi:putative acyl-CoA dehydrogenase [Actinacidiphila reveromycinica]|uniref:Putative acyl-CoA dehydrogenase n=1 Tax=Actinacidiphila reveromycinica TaxID=659352 RepID=A0A7U3V0Q3_9ACTN|nr:acyl-CoA dehydrogenase family protein [Streptomyces sp. SN-593]BBB02233.1 putative acyl-CoA dehydrogenase [Streptomyces sp. SN-593]
MSDLLATELAELRALVGDQPEAWDLAGELPVALLRKAGERGLLCAEVPASYGGLGASSADNGEFTASVGALCSSLRSIMTSQGIAAWTIQRIGDREQRRRFLAELTGGKLAAVAFSEPGAGSDLSAMRARITPEGDTVVLDGQKKWITGAKYADVILVLARQGDDAAFAVVPADAPGVTIEPVPAPMGCRAAGHSDVRFDQVRLPASAVLAGGGQSLPLLFTTALSYGRMSVAWGCLGIVRACLHAATAHARSREQGGKRLADHQLVARHLASLVVAEQISARACEHASRRWDANSADLVVSAVTAKHVAAGQAARAAATAVQVLASAGATDGHTVARAYRDAKLMEIIEGSNEICELILAEHALTAVPDTE